MNKCDECGKTIFDDSRRYREHLKKVRSNLNSDNLCLCYDCIKKYNKAFDIRLQQSLARALFNDLYKNKYD